MIIRTKGWVQLEFDLKKPGKQTHIAHSVSEAACAFDAVKIGTAKKQEIKKLRNNFIDAPNA